jgi:hypothetical protein
MVEVIPSEQDEAIYAAWESGKTLRVLAREFGISPLQVEQAIDRCLPVFSAQTQMRAYKREIQKLEDLGTKYYAKAMQDEIESAHIYARINERYCAMQGWTSVNIRLDPYAAQVQEQVLPRHEKIRQVIMNLCIGDGQQSNDGNGQQPNGDGSPPD